MLSRRAAFALTASLLPSFALAQGADAAENAALVYQKAFQDWLAGPGAKYRFQKFVSKKK